MTSDLESAPSVESPECHYRSSTESPLAQLETFATCVETTEDFGEDDLESVCQLASAPSFIAAAVEDCLAIDIAVDASTRDAFEAPFEPLKHTFDGTTSASTHLSEVFTQLLGDLESSKALTEPEPPPAPPSASVASSTPEALKRLPPPPQERPSNEPPGSSIPLEAFPSPPSWSTVQGPVSFELPIIGDVAPCSLVNGPDPLEQCHDGSNELVTLAVPSPPTHGSVPSQSQSSEPCATYRVSPRAPDPDPEVNASTCDALEATFKPREAVASYLEPIPSLKERDPPDEYPVALLTSESPSPTPRYFACDPEALVLSEARQSVARLCPSPSLIPRRG